MDRLVRTMRGLCNDQRGDTDARSVPPLNADERDTLEGWLDFHRATLAIKCAGLDDAQAANPSTPPSTFTLTGLVQHMAEVERTWFRRVFAGEQAPPIYDPLADPDGPEGGFTVAEGATLEEALPPDRHRIRLRRPHRCGRRRGIGLGAPRRSVPTSPAGDESALRPGVRYDRN